MKFVTILIAVLGSLVAAAPPTTRHFYTSDVTGEYARNDGFVGGPFLWGYGVSAGTPDSVPLFRCRAPVYDVWFLTTSSNCEGNTAFINEGSVFSIYTSQVPGSQPLDRYINIIGDHMHVRRDWYPYSPSRVSCDYGYYAQEGTTGFILTGPGTGTIPLYEFRKGRNNDREQCPY